MYFQDNAVGVLRYQDREIECSPGLSDADIKSALRYQRRADALTGFRLRHSKELGIAIGLSEKRWITTAACGAMWATDWLDGYYAKKARNILGAKGPLSDGPREDPRADKSLMWWSWAGIATRAVRESDAVTTGAVALVALRTAPRDARMEENRKTVETFDLGTGVGAIRKNRIKTFGQALASFALISPLSTNNMVKNFALGTLVASTELGVMGEREYRNMVDASLVEKAFGMPFTIGSGEAA